MVDEHYLLNDIRSDHPKVSVDLLIPFVRYRLATQANTDGATLQVTLQPFDKRTIRTSTLRLSWDAQTADMPHPPVQRYVVTEWAAYGIACVVLAVYTPFRLARIAEVGDRFDYWIANGSVLYGLEVSGLLQGNIAARHREKIRQLQANPYGVDGFVCIVEFNSTTILLSAHRGI